MSGWTCGGDRSDFGLANPLGGTPRGRLVWTVASGHDKNLFPDWAVAEGPFLKIPGRTFPAYLDQDLGGGRAEVRPENAPATRGPCCLRSAAPMGFGGSFMFKTSWHAPEFTSYRINRGAALPSSCAAVLEATRAVGAPLTPGMAGERGLEPLTLVLAVSGFPERLVTPQPCRGAR